MSDSLLAAAILGLSRRPLAEADQRLAAQLLGNSEPPLEQALTLATYSDLEQRASMELGSEEATIQTTEIPGHATEHLHPEAAITYLHATAQLNGQPDFWWFWQHRKRVPAEAIMLVLEQLVRKQKVNPRVYTLLGPRGRWLGSHHPAYKGKIAPLTSDKRPSGAGQQASLAAIHLSAYTADPQSGEASDHRAALLDLLKTAKVSTVSIQELLPKNEEVHPIAPYLLSQLLLERQSISTELISSTEFDADAQTQLDLTLVERDIDAFSRAARYAIASASSAQAAELLKLVFQSTSILLRRHPLLGALFAVLDASAFAKTSQFAIARTEHAWQDERLVTCFRESGHAFSLPSSTELIEQLYSQRHFDRNATAGEWVAQLHLGATDYLIELIHDTGGTPQLNQLLVALEARKRMEESPSDADVMSGSC